MAYGSCRSYGKRQKAAFPTAPWTAPNNGAAHRSHRPGDEGIKQDNKTEEGGNFR
jgi:hypothetical protein